MSGKPNTPDHREGLESKIAIEGRLSMLAGRTDTAGHSLKRSRAMRDHLEELKLLGIEAINDRPRSGGSGSRGRESRRAVQVRRSRSLRQ